MSAALSHSEPLVTADNDHNLPPDVDLLPCTPSIATRSSRSPLSPGSSSSFASLSSSSISSSSTLYHCPALTALVSRARPNDRLAVLLPKDLWKPDRCSSVCDSFYCRVSFGLFERRHHCRRCGSIFCDACTQHTTPLLDTSNLPFFYPPCNHSIVEYESPESPIVDVRVCDDCYNRIYGIHSTPHTPTRPSIEHVQSRLISIFKLRRSAISRCEASECPLSSTSPISQTCSLRPSGNSSPRQRNTSTRCGTHLPLSFQLERSYGDLDAYPLRWPSVLCKVTGGGRWEPKQSPVLAYELEMQREEQEEQHRRENPIIIDGDIKYRYIGKQPNSVGVVLLRRLPQAIF